jgi:hypothetical protein
VLAAFAVTGLAVVLAEGEGGDGEDAGGPAPAGVPPLPLEGGKPADVGGGGEAARDQEAQVTRAVREYVEGTDEGDELDRRRGLPGRGRRGKPSYPIATMRSIGTRARSAISSGTLTSCFRSRSESRSLGSVIIFM